jgi:FKBP-type peptidyl-prolyl cis-trans isomerase FkpA
MKNNLNRMSRKLLFIAPALLLFACGPDYEETEYDIEIAEYLEDKDWETDRQESGLYVYSEDAGAEEKASTEDFLTLNYTGYLLDGSVFDGTDGNPITFPFPLSGLIEGWQEGIQFFGKGGKGKLIIPPNLGYGSEDVGPIAANSVLVFDIEIIDFTSTPPPPPAPIDFSETIEAYMLENNIEGAIKTEDGLYISIEEAGSEVKPTLSDFVTIFYKGYLLDGFVFDQTEEETRTFPLNGLIAGWQIGIPYLGKGGKAKLMIPPHIGYGPQDNGDIPGNSVLIFEIELVDFSDAAPVQ